MRSPRRIVLVLVLLHLSGGLALAAPRVRDVWHSYVADGKRYGYTHTVVVRLPDGNFRITRESRLLLDFLGSNKEEIAQRGEYVLTADDPAYFYPFLYDDEEFPDLVHFITPQYGDPDGALSAWARGFLDEQGMTPTFNILSGMTHGIREAFIYRKRHEHGTQHPLDTLQTKSGTCRDYALFMIEALRRLGNAARFVSGYLSIPGDRAHGYVGGGSTHAWVQVYLPSAGWIEFDPTNGIIGTRDLIRVAVARDPRQAIPLHGTYLGSADAFVGMHVSIDVAATPEEVRV